MSAMRCLVHNTCIKIHKKLENIFLLLIHAFLWVITEQLIKATLACCDNF